MKVGARVRVVARWSMLHDELGTVVEVLPVDEAGHVVRVKLDDHPRQHLRFGVESLRVVEEPEPHWVAGE